MKHLFIILAFSLLSVLLPAQILTFEFNGITGNEEAYGSNTNNTNLESSTISRGKGLHASANADRFNATNWGEIDIATSVTDKNYMEFTIEPKTGYEFSVTSIYIQLMRSATGPSAIAIRSSADDFATNLDAEYAIDDVETQQTFTFTFSQTSYYPITYRIYMYAEDEGGSGGIGDKAGNDLVVNGSVSHIPSANQIIITRNCDPDLNYDPDRYAEIYNAGDQNVDITGWKLHNIQNTVDKFQWTFSGTINAGDTWVCARADNTDQTISPDVTATWVGGDWNGTGGDGTILKDGGGTIMDYAVQSGTTNKFTNRQMKRKQTILKSNSSFDADEWFIKPVNNANDLLPGVHGTVWRNNNVTWGGTNNWDCEVPTKYVDVFIVSGSNQPHVNIAGECKNINIASGSVLTINKKRSLTVFATLSNNAGATGLVLISDADGASSLITQTNSISATVESYFVDLGQWYLISPPISNATAEVYNLQYLDTWDETTDSWVDITVGTTALNPCQGYSVKKTNANGDGNTATYTGILNNGDINISGLTFTSGSTYAGWNLVGNPYPSVLDIDKLVFPTGIGASASVWKHDGSGYLSWSQSGTGSNKARYVQPGQGFMVKLSADDKTLPFTNAARTHKKLSKFDKSEDNYTNDTEVLSISIPYNTGENTSYISFREGASLGFDPNYDVIKLFGLSEYPDVFSYIDIEENELAAIQSFPQPAEGDIVHLGLRIGSTGNYELRFSGMSTFAADQNFLVLDNKTDEVYEIRIDSIIPFTYETGDNENRFDLIFDMTTNIDEAGISQEEIIVFINNRKLYIKQMDSFNLNAQIGIYDILGQKLIEEKIGDATRGIPVDLPSAYYIIKIQSEKETITKKIFIP